ncbi:hypothetical protein CKM354_000505200 [Cercospora kikuchii]|uniref:Serine hydrolase domain-containing protein n=1 Tax=Cercospora kikuchii TaxID=84275 RepID=A0A9P3CEI0_9PEZI|nr:uncharacterized protein CKM354_000505200 [Cercospora kikuchii]GIZ41757.1 hypothetical protein CKM354_000505200 [Cercospora kikuchii]
MRPLARVQALQQIFPRRAARSIMASTTASTSHNNSSKQKQKLRILCLHGFTSNSHVSAFQLRRLVSAFGGQSPYVPPQDSNSASSDSNYEYEFLFANGPHIVKYSSSDSDGGTAMDPTWHEFVFGLHEDSAETGHRAWWFAKDPDWKNKKEGEFEGIERSFEDLGKWIRESGKEGDDEGIDAIWGFSQGACLAGMLCGLLSRRAMGGEEQHPLLKLLGLKQEPERLKAGIIFSGFRARFRQYDGIYEEGIGIPMLHVLGEKDPLVGSERSEALLRVCEKGEVLRFDGGHEIPKREEDVRTIVEFLRRALEGDEVEASEVRETRERAFM